MNNSNQKIGYLRSIDFLRGVAALGVCISHISHGLSYESTNKIINAIHHFTVYGNLGVPVFFVISGFCIHRKKAEQLVRQIDEPVEFAKYWKRRFFRLYPSYFVTCIFSAFSLFIAIKLGISSIMVSKYPGDPYLYLVLDLVAHLLMIHCFFYYFDTGLGNGALWTIAREEQYYLLYFPLLKIRKRFGVFLCLVISLIASIMMFRWSLQLEQTNPDLVRITRYSSLFFWPQWILGMLSVEIIAGLVSGRHFFRHPLFFVIGILLIIWGVESSSIDFWTQQMIFGIAAFILITHIASTELNGGWKSNKILRTGEFVGNYSYSLYLIHTPIVVLLTKIGRVTGTRDSVILFLIMLILCLLFIQIPAYLLYYLVERHGQSKRTVTNEFTTESC